MKREDALVTLSRLEPSLRSQGLAHLYLFGSVARNDATPGSDVDVAFDVEPALELKFSLIDQSRVMRQISEALHAPVDLVERAYLRPRIAENVATEMIQVF
jgi:uncharacterized protein